MSPHLAHPALICMEKGSKQHVQILRPSSILHVALGIGMAHSVCGWRRACRVLLSACCRRYQEDGTVIRNHDPAKAMLPLFRLVICRRYVSIDPGRHGGQIVTFLSRRQQWRRNVTCQAALATSNSVFVHTRMQSKLHRPHPSSRTAMIMQFQPLKHSARPHLSNKRTITAPTLSQC